MSLAKATETYRLDAKQGHTLLTKEEREQLIKPYLPAPPNSLRRSLHDNSSAGSIRFGVRSFLRQQFYALIYAILHLCFSVYIRFRVFWHAVLDRTFAILYYHHRTPGLIQKDVKGLKRLPKHLSVVLKLENGGKGGAGLEILVDELAEISAWCACVGIPTLSVYEETGILKSYIPPAHRAITRKLASYFGASTPSLSLQAPHVPSMNSATNTPASEFPPSTTGLRVLLLSADDGRDALVDLTKTLAVMSQRRKLLPSDITIDLIDAEISENGLSEPDLLILFSPTVELSGYPPWQIRLTEIFHVQDNQGVGYQVFLRALYNYANASMRFGR